MIIELIPIAFLICMTWVCAWLQVNVISYSTTYWGTSVQVGFLQTPYGIALIISIVIIEIALARYIYDL